MSVFVLSACAGTSKYMRPVSPGYAVYAPQEGKALVFFMRPSGMAYAIDASVFDGDEFIGIVPAKKKVAYMAQPGEHLFMVIGESADFMKADLKAGKVYYTLVTSRMGAWKARFSLKPIHGDEIDSARVKEWFDSSEYIENHTSAYRWAEENRPSIMKKREKYLPKWEQKSNKPFLRPEDGRLKPGTGSDI